MGQPFGLITDRNVWLRLLMRQPPSGGSQTLCTERGISRELFLMSLLVFDSQHLQIVLNDEAPVNGGCMVPLGIG